MNHKEIEAILNVHKLAFGPAEGEEIAALAASFLDHPGTLSISVERDGIVAGNVLFTPFEFRDHPKKTCYLLAPCGVLPDYQGHGVGKELMETSINRLASVGTDAVFVLGVPAFYPKYGFAPTDKQTPYPDLLTVPEAWMALDLSPGTVDQLSGPTTAIPPFMISQMWDTSQHG